MPDAARRPPQRRSSDPRIDDILDMVRAFAPKMDRLDDRIDQLREFEAARKVAEAELLRRVQKSEDHHKDQDGRIDALEGWRAEFRGMTILVGIVAAVASIMVALHAVGAW